MRFTVMGQALTLRNGREMCCASAIKDRLYAINLAYNLANGFGLTTVNKQQLVATLCLLLLLFVFLLYMKFVPF